MVTFKACTEGIKYWEPDAFLLENVEMSEDDGGEGNLDVIVKILQSLGYKVQVFRVLASDYALPTRRVRLYLGGFNQKKQPDACFKTVDQLLSLFKMKPQPPESWTLLRTLNTKLFLSLVVIGVVMIHDDSNYL